MAESTAERSRFRILPCVVLGTFVAAASFLVAAGCSSESADGPSRPGPGGDGRTDEDGSTGPKPSSDGGSTTDDGGIVVGPDGDVPVSCEGVDCSGRGLCQPSTGTCACDEGFDGPTCANRNADYGKRVKIAQGLADPDVIKLSDDRYVLSGTAGGQATEFRFLESTDLTTWTPGKVYRPSDLDPAHRYCWMWAPAIVQEGTGVALYFSALQLGKFNGNCPSISDSGNDVATFRAFAEGDSFDFGKPEPLFPGTSGPRTYTGKGCPELCGNAIRIDAAVEDGRLYYVYFAGGNNIASVKLSNASQQLFHSGPDIAGSRDADEGIINEAPELFSRDGRLYLFFSTADFRGPYTTRYMMGTTPNDLRRSQTTALRLTTPAYGKNGKLVETHGHNSVTTRHGETFNFFHLGIFDGNGGLVRRDTYRQRIVWKDDGTAVNQNAVTVSWNSLGGSYVYSLDLVLRDGSTVGPCLGSGILGKGTSVTYTGVCKDGGDRLVHKADIAAFRLYASAGSGYQKVGEADYDGFSDTANVSITAP